MQKIGNLGAHALFFYCRLSALSLPGLFLTTIYGSYLTAEDT